MTIARTWAVGFAGITGHMVEVEADLSQQTPGFQLVGSVDRALGEAVSRVHNACKNSDLELPRRKLTVNLSPASLPKHGSGFDLAIAIAALSTEGALDMASVMRTVHLGELGLDGRVRPISGVLPAVRAAREAGFTRVFVPHANADEARLVTGVEVHAISTLAAAAILHGADIDMPDVEPVRAAPGGVADQQPVELSDVVGQSDAVEAMIVAAAGGHHMLLSGPPGAGKTMIARRMPGVLPELDDEDALEVASVRSLAGEAVVALDREPPFVAPHHGASLAALVGGGSRQVRTGAIVRAHRGVLFLDEAAEFSGVALDALRQPLEAGVIEVHRAGFVAAFPARFQLLLATNPCPCGLYGVRGEECTCAPSAIRRYAGRLSGPLRDRIDIEVHVSRVSRVQRDPDGTNTVTTALARARVENARRRASHRLSGTPWRLNAEVPGQWLRQGEQRLSAKVTAPLDRALDKGHLTLRGYDRVLRLAWTITDLDGVDTPGFDQVGRALFLKKGMSV